MMIKILFLFSFYFLQVVKSDYSQNELFRSDYKILPGTRNFYKIHTFRRTWGSAKWRCEIEGTSLFYPQNHRETKVFLEYFTTEQPTLDAMFIGVFKQTTGIFNTIDGKTIGKFYNNWTSEKVINSSDAKDCLVMRKDGTLVNENCSRKYPFVCMKKSASTSSAAWNKDCNTADMDYKLSSKTNRCYKFHLNPLNWIDAFEVCDAEQAYLAIVNSQEEANYLVNMTKYAPKEDVKGPYLRGAVHLGFKFDSTEDDWRTTTVQTLKEAGYALWGYRQPDGGQSERCGSMFYTGELNDIGCRNKKCFFICEKENSQLSFLSDRHDAQPEIKFFRDDYRALKDTGNVYKIHAEAKTWADAKRRCALEGTTLFYPEDSFEAETVLDYMKTTQPSISSVFVGISSQLAKGVFMTIDGIAVRNIHNKWLPGEPNNSNGEEDCVILDRNGFYNDEKCNKNYPFICKKSIASIKWNNDCNVPYLDYKYSNEQRKCYKFHLNPLNWKNAAEACEAEQAYLAIANSQQEADYFANITAQAPKDKIQGWYLRGAVHLGFLFNKTLNDWTTIQGETLKQAGYDGWGYYQPDGGESERCGSMFYGGELNDIGCELHKCFFICEKDNDYLNTIDDTDGLKNVYKN